MKRTLITVLIVALAAIAYSQNHEQQPKTLFDNDYPMSNGGYGGPFTKYGKILDQDAWFMGARGGWLIDHRFTIGLAGQGLVSRVVHDPWLPPASPSNMEARLFTGYGGFLMEPIFFYKSPVHIAMPIVIGAGGATYGIQEGNVWGSEVEFPEDGAAFFVLEPGLEIEISAVRFMRINIGASYLYTSDILLPNVDGGFMRGFRGTFGLKFGAF